MAQIGCRPHCFDGREKNRPLLSARSQTSLFSSLPLSHHLSLPPTPSPLSRSLSVAVALSQSISFPIRKGKKIENAFCGGKGGRSKPPEEGAGGRLRKKNMTTAILSEMIAKETGRVGGGAELMEAAGGGSDDGSDADDSDDIADGGLSDQERERSRISRNFRAGGEMRETGDDAAGGGQKESGQGEGTERDREGVLDRACIMFVIQRWDDLRMQSSSSFFRWPWRGSGMAMEELGDGRGRAHRCSVGESQGRRERGERGRENAINS